MKALTMNRTIALVAALLMGTAALAQGSDSAVEAARDQGLVGEQADGYLGFPRAPSGDLKSRVDQINIKRRAAYTDLAAQRGVTVSDVAAATACQLFKSRVGQGQMYRDEGGVWRQNSGTPNMPSYCG